MKISLSVITYNSEDTLAKTLESVQGLADEIVIIDAFSTDKTVSIAKQFGAKVLVNKYLGEGEQRNFGLKRMTGEWVLVLDDDEVVSPGLRKEILLKVNNVSNINGFIIPYQNYFLGKALEYGGENYEMLRLFKRKVGYSDLKKIHAQYHIRNGETFTLKNKIYHFSYRSIPQLYYKFTLYGFREAKIKKGRGEKTSLKKITIYPIHMFWARFVESKGYKDGLIRIPLDLAFAYLEFLTYFLMLFI